MPRLRAQIAKTKLLILDDWGMAPLSKTSRLDLMELIEDANGGFSVAITPQLPINAWHDYIGDPTIADAVLDRLVHSAHRIELTGDKLRRTGKKPSVLAG